MKQIIIALVLTISAGHTLAQAKQFQYGSERRRYIIYLPEAYQKKPAKTFPVVFNFHGGGMTMTEQMFYSGMNQTAEKHNFIVVYPQGIKQDWNVGFDMPYHHGSDDIGFIKALLEKIAKDYRINNEMVYATGFSRGGFFCQRLATELPEKFTAIASVGGPIPDSVIYFHQKKIPVAAMMVHGNLDEIVKYEGKANAYRSAAATYDYWKKHNGLSGEKEINRTIDKHSSDSTAIRILETTGKEGSVSLVSVTGGGHTWPGSSPFNIGFPLGKTTREIDINEMMWKFFSRHSRKN